MGYFPGLGLQAEDLAQISTSFTTEIFSPSSKIRPGYTLVLHDGWVCVDSLCFGIQLLYIAANIGFGYFTQSYWIEILFKPLTDLTNLR